MTLRLGLLGCGRIGQTHARAVADVDSAEIAAVFDPISEAAKAIADKSGAKIAGADEIIADPSIDGVLICTPTDLHADQCEVAARVGKAIFCEKPIDLDLTRAEEVAQTVAETQTPFMLGFNRRYDPHFTAMKARLDAGEIGPIELLQITSRDPAPPPIDYIKRSGGLFKDMMIHDIDMARFLLREDLEVTSASAAVRVDPEIGEAGDFDTAVVTLRAPSGALAVITNSRRATYGYDQRIEAHGALGALQAGNPQRDLVTGWGAQGAKTAPLTDFFMERYAEAYRREIQAFAAMARGEDVSAPGAMDGVAALRLADDCARLAGL